MKGVAKQIIGSFEDIGKDIVREAVQVPKDVAQAAMESLGTPSKKPQSPQPASPAGGSPQPERKPIPPRAWLEELAGKNRPRKEPTVQERHEKEKQDKDEKETKQAAVAQKMAPLVTGSSKPKRGNLYNIKQKQASSEMSKNIRQD